MIPCVPDKQMTSPCDLYTTPSLIWLKQQFPADHPAVSRIGQRERIAIKDAWNFFERVEAIDAATRVRLYNNSIQITKPSLWYQFTGDGERMLYEKGRRYHILICPSLNWTPQRNRPIPTTLTSVMPAECPCYNPEGCDVEPLLRSVQPRIAIQEKSPPPTQSPPQKQATVRSATLVKEGIPAKVTQEDTKITIVENTPSTPRSAATPTSTASPCNTGSPHLSGTSTPKSEKENPPALVITDVSLRPSTPTELPADRIQLV